MSTQNIPKGLVQALRGLSPANLNAVKSYAFFLQAKAITDPEQSYFWTRRWQELEKSSSSDKRSGRLIGDGSPEGLIRSFHNHK